MHRPNIAAEDLISWNDAYRITLTTVGPLAADRHRRGFGFGIGTPVALHSVGPNERPRLLNFVAANRLGTQIDLPLEQESRV